LWRITRALIATWHRKLDPSEFPRDKLSSLLSALVSEAPHYHLPEAVHFHTRHYMPVRDKSALIFDAFAQVGREAELIVHWPTLRLDADQLRLLDELLLVMSYLGRAESWVEARRSDEWQGACNCYPSDESVERDSGEIKGDLVPLWLPVSPQAYAEIREAQCARALEREQAELRSKHAQAIAEGKTRRLRDPAKARIPHDVDATLPADWVAAISLDTGELQAAGWSSPPAACRMLYLRPKHALRFMAAAVSSPTPRSLDCVTTARFALYARPLPRITDAVRVGETLRKAVMGRARRLFSDAIPPSLSGHDLPGDNRHNHAFYLSESNHEGRISHLIVHAPGGFDAQARAALAELKTIRTHQGSEWRLLLEGLGTTEAFPSSILPGTSVCWQSVTPYLHPWHRKTGFGVAEQIARECRLRGLPAPVAVEPMPGAKPRALEFQRFRSKRGLSQPDRQGWFVQLRFSEPVRGPLALGFACHFGLGLFVPSDGR
jgi:CRISPR-associated protein Csb2